MIDIAFSAKISVVILNTAMALILAFMAAGFILYLCGVSSLAAVIHSRAVEIILFAPLTVILTLTIISIKKREFFLGLTGALLLLLLLSEIIRKLID
ncbi:MAG: hypothetical protein LBP51_04420 [Deferribacteraceae bacterium]|nr:hypothetical protein [Deferribacteraceae bacterium]